MKKTVSKTLLLSIFLSGMSMNLHAEEEAKKEKEEKTFASITEKKTAHKGFVDIYRDEKDGSG